VILALAIGAALFALPRIRPGLRARQVVEKSVMAFLVLSSTIALFTTVGTVLSVLFDSIRFFNEIPAMDFIFGLEWSP
jgi:phosphate transport system permease protein